jgi:hypothetical protein
MKNKQLVTVIVERYLQIRTASKCRVGQYVEEKLWPALPLYARI